VTCSLSRQNEQGLHLSDEYVGAERLVLTDSEPFEGPEGRFSDSPTLFEAAANKRSAGGLDHPWD
jgi:hypothetical protein